MSNSKITKRVLADAMKKFMSEKPLSKISVGDIVTYCGLNRNSFYYHFKDKYDLVNWIFYTDFVEGLLNESVDSGWDLIERICHFFYNNKTFYTNALSVSGQNSFSEYFVEVMTTAALSEAEDLFKDDRSKEAYTIFFIDSFLTIISKWLKSGAKIPPDELAKLIKNTAKGAAMYVLDESDSM